VVAGLPVVALMLITVATLSDTAAITASLPLPNLVGYDYHAVVGTILNDIGAPPMDAGIQWVKAASHARSPRGVTAAARGIARARSRVVGASSAYFDTTLCAMVRHGSPVSIGAVQQSGIRCSDSPNYRNHVAEGTPIVYDSRPPIGGPHYARWYPHYGVIEQQVLPGYWVHNLEHGAIVLLYNCPAGCPALVAQLRSLYPQLPLGQNPLNGSPRLLVLPDTNMDHQLAVIAWDHLLELDHFDKAQIVAFYKEFVDRGPECVHFRCPP